MLKSSCAQDVNKCALKRLDMYENMGGRYKVKTKN